MRNQIGKKSTLLMPGDEIQLSSFLDPSERTIQANNMSIPVLFNHGDFIVIDKPAGLPTHPNHYQDLKTVANALLWRYPQISGVGEDGLRPGIVHRLDSNTSGLLVVALNQDAYRYFKKLFSERKVKKNYMALVIGQTEKYGEVHYPIAHHARDIKRMIAIVDGKQAFRSRQREAHTYFERLQSYHGFSLLNVRTETGRMHQVRVHLAAIGHPLVGDRLYQGRESRALDTLQLSRHFLHACRIEFPWPDQRLPFIVDSALPPELQQVIVQLRLKNDV